MPAIVASRPRWPAKPRNPQIESRRANSLAQGLVLAVPLHENGGATLHDLVNGYAGALMNTPAWGSSPVGPALTLVTASSQYVDFGNAVPAVQGLTTLSISAWVMMPANAGAKSIIISKDNNGTIEWMLNVTGGSPQVGMRFGLTETDSGTTLSLNTWHHVAATRDASGNVAIWIDGANVKPSTANAGTITGGTGHLYIGAWNLTTGTPAPAGFFPGSVAGVAVWRRVLSSAEIQTLYTDPYALYTPPTPTSVRAASQALPGLSGVIGNAGDGTIVAAAVAQRVNFTGANTSWLTTAPTITVSSGSLGAITVDSDTTAHANFTPSTSAGVVTFTDTTDASSTASLTTIAAATTYTFTGPTTGSPSVAQTYTLTLTGAVTSAVTVTPAASPDGTWSPTTVTFPANTNSPSVTSQYTPASVGTKTLSVTNSGSLTNPSSISDVISNTPGLIGDVNLKFTDNWEISGTSFARTNCCGATLDTVAVIPVGGGSLVFHHDTSDANSASLPSADMPVVTIVIDNVATDYQLTPQAADFTITTASLSAGNHTVEYRIKSFYGNPGAAWGDQWGTTSASNPPNVVKLTSITGPSGWSTSAPTLPSFEMPAFGDSILGGFQADPNEGRNINGNANLVWIRFFAMAFGCRPHVIAFPGQGVTKVSNANLNVPGAMTAWNLQRAGVSRSWSACSSPKYVVSAHNQNNGTAVAADYVSWWGALRTQWPNATVFVCTSISNQNASVCRSAFTTWNDANSKLLDISANGGLDGLQGGGSTTDQWAEADSVQLHPGPKGHARVAAIFAQLAQKALSVAGGRRRFQ